MMSGGYGGEITRPIGVTNGHAYRAAHVQLRVSIRFVVVIQEKDLHYSRGYLHEVISTGL